MVTSSLCNWRTSDRHDQRSFSTVKDIFGVTSVWVDPCLKCSDRQLILKCFSASFQDFMWLGGGQDFKFKDLKNEH